MHQPAYPPTAAPCCLSWRPTRRSSTSSPELRISTRPTRPTTSWKTGSGSPLEPDWNSSRGQAQVTRSASSARAGRNAPWCTSVSTARPDRSPSDCRNWCGCVWWHRGGGMLPDERPESSRMSPASTEKTCQTSTGGATVRPGRSALIRPGCRPKRQPWTGSWSFPEDPSPQPVSSSGARANHSIPCSPTSPADADFPALRAQSRRGRPLCRAGRAKTAGRKRGSQTSAARARSSLPPSSAGHPRARHHRRHSAGRTPCKEKQVIDAAQSPWSREVRSSRTSCPQDLVEVALRVRRAGPGGVGGRGCPLLRQARPPAARREGPPVRCGAVAGPALSP